MRSATAENGTQRRRNSPVRNSENLKAWGFAAPALIVFTLIVVVPVVWSLSLSFYHWGGLGATEFIGLDNYRRMMTDRVFWQVLGNNLVFTVLGSLVQVFLGMAMALLLLSIKAFRNLLKVVYFIPTVISSVAISLIFVRLLSAEPEGVVNAFFRTVGLDGLRDAYLSNPDLALVIVTLVDAYKFCAIYMIIYYTALVSIDQEILEAAELDGANWLQQFISIKMPLVQGVIAATVIMVVSGTLKGFDVSYIMTNGGPGASSELVATYLYKTVFQSLEFGYGSAMAVFLAVECLAIVAIIRWLFRKQENEA